MLRRATETRCFAGAARAGADTSWSAEIGLIGDMVRPWVGNVRTRFFGCRLVGDRFPMGGQKSICDEFVKRQGRNMIDLKRYVIAARTDAVRYSGNQPRAGALNAQGQCDRSKSRLIEIKGLSQSRLIEIKALCG